MEKTYKDDIIRKDTDIGDVKLTVHNCGRRNIKIVFVSCYHTDSGEVIYTEDIYKEGMDKQAHIDICIPKLKATIKQGE